MYRLKVINPNSSEAVTRGIADALLPFHAEDLCIECLTLAAGPATIATQRDADTVIVPLLQLLEAQRDQADAFIIACYSDPGLYSARECTGLPVFGAAQCALAFAATLGDRVGVLSLSSAAVFRHNVHARASRQDQLIVADLPLAEDGIAGADDAAVLERLLSQGQRLISQYHANVIVLGCAGWCRWRSTMEQQLGVPVIDPIQAATGAALTALRGGYTTMGP